MISPCLAIFKATSVQKVLDIFWIPSLGPEPEVESVVPGCAHFPDNILLDGLIGHLKSTEVQTGVRSVFLN